MTTESTATAVGTYAHEGADAVERALKTDPIQSAENITGKSYKEDEDTLALGMLLHMEHGRIKQDLLRTSRDTHYGMTYAEYMAVVHDLGFVTVVERPFEYSKHRDEPVTLHAVVCVHPLGAIISFTTYASGGYHSETEGRYVPLTETINGGKLYYNWKPNKEYRRLQEESWALNEEARVVRKEAQALLEDSPQREALLSEYERLSSEAHRIYPPNVTSSGGMENSNPEIPDEIPNPDYDDSPEARYDYDNNPRKLKNPEFSREQWVWVGDHDCREALRHNIAKLLEWGDFVTPWVKMPFGVDTMDLNESSERFYHSMWPPRNKSYERVEGESSLYADFSPLPLEGQALRIAHQVIANEMEASDVARWPQRMLDIVGPAALAERIASQQDRVTRELERFNLVSDDLPEVEVA